MPDDRINKPDYSDNDLVILLAKGEKTYGQVAEAIGISEAMVAAISRGERRPELQEKINEACEGMLEQARRLGKRLASVAMGRLGSLVAKDSKAKSDVQRKAAVDILNHALGDPGKTEINVNQSQQNTPGMTAEDYEYLAERKKGPK